MATMIENDWAQDERREYERHSVDFYLRVREHETEALLGDVVDISLGGMRLLSEKPIPVDKTFLVQLEISLENNIQEEIIFQVRSVWAQKDINPDLYNTGFAYMGMPPQALASIQKLLDYLGSDD